MELLSQRSKPSCARMIHIILGTSGPFTQYLFYISFLVFYKPNVSKLSGNFIVVLLNLWQVNLYTFFLKKIKKHTAGSNTTATVQNSVPAPILEFLRGAVYCNKSVSRT